MHKLNESIKNYNFTKIQRFNNMRIFILSLFGSGVILALICGFLLFIKNSKLENVRKQLKERGINTTATVIDKKFKKTRRIIHVTGRLQNFDSFQLRLKFNSKAKGNKSEPAISFNKALQGKESVGDIGSSFVEFTKEVGKDFYNSLKKGDSVPIVFLPENSEEFEVLENEGEFAVNKLLWFSLGCFAFSVVSLLMFMQYYRTGTTF